MIPSLRPSDASRGRLARATAVVACIALQACSTPQDYLHPAGTAARGLANLGWFVLVVMGIAAIVVWLILSRIALRHPGTFAEHDDVDREDGQRWIVVGGFIIPAAVLIVTLFATLRTLSAYPLETAVRDFVCSTRVNTCPTPTIRVRGQQWWFDVEYLFGNPDLIVRGPTEIHIPVGQPVDIELMSQDVIHSFWIPKLHGKVDIIPGQRNFIRIEASAPGTYWGECGEYCGVQHANMRLMVMAHPEDEFQQWLAQQRASAADPGEREAAHGRDVFMNAACPLCHTVRGTPAHGHVGPDLTHVASRRRIAGGMLENNTANLAAWVTRAQSLKPGSQMPDLTQFTGADLRALVAYLQGLK